MTPQEIVHELDKHIVGQDRAKRAVAIALAQPLAPAAGGRAAAPGDHAQEHPDDRAHGRGQDRDRAAAVAARRRTVHQGRGDQVHRSRLRRPRRGHHRPRPGGNRHQAGSRAGDAQSAVARRGPGRGARARCAAAAGAQSRLRLVGRGTGEQHSPEVPQEAARRRAERQGDRDRDGRSAAADGDPRPARDGGAHLPDPEHVSEPRRRAPQAAQAAG